jgi:hypothetical protein
MKIPIYRNGTQISSFKADESTVYTYQLMGQHKIVANFQVVAPLPIQIGDYITFKGQNFYLNIVPSIKADHLLEYSVVFESLIYRLNDKILLDEGNMNFTYYGDAQNYLELIVVNMNEIDPGWSVGTVDQTVDKHIQFEGRVNCLAALGQISKEFGLEYYLTGKTINLVKQAGTTTAHTFRYGRQKGLYGLSRNYVDDKNIVTKVFGFGSDKNLPVGYRNGATQLIFNEKFLTQNTELYGIKEGVYEDNEVFPQRTGTVQSASTSLDTGVYTITDSTIDFNINDYLLPGVTAKIIFKTGELAGYEFEITGYNNTTKVITYKSFTDSANYVLPNATFSAQVGDQYVLIDMGMPQSYIDAEELKLKNRTIDYLAENSVPRVSYALELDPLHAKVNNIDLVPGDKVTIIDERLGVNTLIRVNSISYPVTFPDHLVKDRTFFNAEIADFVSYTIQEKLKADTRDVKKEVKAIDRTIRSKQAILRSELNNATNTMNNVARKTDFLTTTVDQNVVATGTMIVGNAAGENNAGITGVTDLGDESVRFYAGATYANKNIAPWRVLNNGNMYSTAGYIGGFKILQNSLESANNYGAGKFVLYPDSGYMAFIDNSVGYWGGIGANVFPATAGVRCVGRFDNTGFSGSDNYGISVTAKNGTRNIGIAVEGDIMFHGNSRIRNHAVKTGVVSDGSTFTTTDQGALLFNGSGSAILPTNPSDGRTVTVNGIGGTIQVKSPDKIIRDRGDQIAINTYMTGISWGRTFTYFENVNAWICTGYLN